MFARFIYAIAHRRRLVYVGQTRRPWVRICGHRARWAGCRMLILEATFSLRDAADAESAWIDALRRGGHPIRNVRRGMVAGADKGYSEWFSVTIPVAVSEQLKRLAAEDGMSVRGYIRRIWIRAARLRAAVDRGT